MNFNGYIVTGAFIIIDVITGILKALYNKKINSTILRKGLFHKLSEVIAVVGAGGLTFYSKFIPFTVDLPLLEFVSTYICVMELISIIENLCEINPTLAKLFKPYLEKLHTLEGDNKNE